MRSDIFIKEFDLYASCYNKMVHVFTLNRIYINADVYVYIMRISYIRF